MRDRLNKYADLLKGCSMIKDAPMSEYTTFRIGGAADLMIFPANRDELIRALDAAKKMDIPHCIIGNGSNLLVSDDGIEGVVIRISSNFSGIEICGNTVKALAGTSMSMVTRESLDQGLMGLEWAAGIPGTLGGAAAMNAGAYGGEMKQVVRRVEYISDGGIFSVVPDDEDMSYRFSRYSAPERIVISVEMELQPDDGKARERVQDYACRRREKQPLSYPSAGSTFKRPEGTYAGLLIEEAGLKGLRIGGAEVSRLHAGFIINTGGATCKEVLRLIEIVTDEVMAKSGILLETEIKHIGR